MSGYLSKLADRLAGGGFDGRVSPSVSAFTGYGRRISGETPESEEPASNAEIPVAEWVSGGFEGRSGTDHGRLSGPIASAYSQPRITSPDDATGPGSAVRRARSNTEVPEDFLAPLEPPFGGPGLTNKRSSLADHGPEMSTSGFSLPGNSGPRQQEDLEHGALLQIEGDVSPYGGRRETEPLSPQPAGDAPRWAKGEMRNPDPTEEGKPRAQSPVRTPQEASDAMPFETAASRLEPADMAETAAIPRLSPRQINPPPTPPEAPEQPKLVIGRISVEVVRQSEPSLKRPVHTGSREPNRSGTRPSGHDTGLRTNLNFGLGQV